MCRCPRATRRSPSSTGTPAASIPATFARSRRWPVPPELAAGRDAVRRVLVADEVLAYIVDIATATRLSPSLQLGVSPRGATALLATARSWAWLTGRGYVTPDDVKAMARPTCDTASHCGPRPNWKALRQTAFWRASSRRSRCHADGPHRSCGIDRVARSPADRGIEPSGNCFSWCAWPRSVQRSASISPLAGKLTALRFSHSAPSSIRLGEPVDVTLQVRNDGRRRIRGAVREAWPRARSPHHAFIGSIAAQVDRRR